LLKSNPNRPKTKTLAGKRWKAAQSKPSVTTAKVKLKVSRPKSLKPKAPRPVKPELLKIPVEKRVGKIVELLRANYPDADCSLEHVDAFQLLIATLLSAQCTDERVNKVTPALFARFPTAAAMAKADQLEVEKLIFSTGFYRAKAKNAIAAAQKIMEVHGGEVPRTMEELSVLPGVGRKTSNVVLGNAFGIPGVTVDTHVFRLSHRLGLSKGKNPEVVEKDLEKLLPPEDWTQWAHWLISHGRAICIARKPLCTQCFLLKHCPQII
jgi:endonuclease III